MARRAVERELSRERILEAARHLFITKGYRAISMRSIGQHLGYSHGSLYYHFKEKAELFYAIVMKDFNDLAILMNEVSGRASGDGHSKIEQLLLEFVRFGLDHPYQYEIMFMIRDEELLAYCRSEQSRCFDMFSSLVRKHLLEDACSDEERHHLPLSLFLGMHGFISFYIQDRVSFDEIKPAAVAHVKTLCRSFYTKV
ncbi:TetR/AcrR family transcriptional regulator [Paenibacillus sp. F411]|uniref:Transcriptional regulator, TetR family protein n=1 Tax=Paenibacillus algicola TaxID=2565926 RepID=A0A4P8XTB9_9BACL|nr:MULTISPECIES: TetR/AcrR family transcriptional regulator [Paenibacillus]MBO2943435.1 TetR/AcrR family transcriptional regulator [Paenibacillus sp. F411]QCT03959.1 transcriptional regulator, TetR family protein [Paenibacillus algicola]